RSRDSGESQIAIPTTSSPSTEMHSYARSMPSGKSRGRQERLNSSRVPGFNRRDVIQTYCPSSSMTRLLRPAKGERSPYRRTARLGNRHVELPTDPLEQFVGEVPAGERLVVQNDPLLLARD